MNVPKTRGPVRQIARIVVRLLASISVTGRENLPQSGPLLVVFNHLGHLDAAVLIGVLPYNADAVALSDLYRVPVTGHMLRLYGTIPVHRDMFDRTVLDSALAVLNRRGVLILAPEARMSVTGALEKARGGAAYLALKTQAPILPIGLTGTSNKTFYGELKRLRRPRVTMTIGQVFRLPDLPLSGAARKESIAEASTIIMTRLAELLPPSYRGVYADAVPGGRLTAEPQPPGSGKNRIEG